MRWSDGQFWEEYGNESLIGECWFDRLVLVREDDRVQMQRCLLSYTIGYICVQKEKTDRVFSWSNDVGTLLSRLVLLDSGGLAWSAYV
jgi:hypothetical protein